MPNIMQYREKGKRCACRICGKFINCDESRLSTSVSGIRRISVTIAIHTYHLSRKELDKILVDEL